MQNLKVNNVIISKQAEASENLNKFKQIVKEKNISLKIINKGDRLNIEKDVFFDFFWPNEKSFINENPLNNNSIVCKLNYHNFSMLFTGDIEEEAELSIVQEYGGGELSSTILKVAHHGSKTSSSKTFIEQVKPKIALIGVGKNNKFGHPNSDVIKEIKNFRRQSI